MALFVNGYPIFISKFLFLMVDFQIIGGNMGKWFKKKKKPSWQTVKTFCNDL